MTDHGTGPVDSGPGEAHWRDASVPKPTRQRLLPDGGEPGGADDGDAPIDDDSAAGESGPAHADEPPEVPPPPGVPAASSIEADVLRGHADGLESRVDALHEIAADARAAFEAPADPEERAMAYCQHGLWPVLAVYVDRRSAGARLGQPHHDRLQTALNTWLELYARCYGVETEYEFSVREAAALFVDTHNVRDVAALLTDVPDR